VTAQHGPVGMVGVGNMGGRMTRRLIEAGYDVRAVDTDPARITASGAQPAGSLAALAASSDVIMLSLPDSSVIESVVRGPDGLLAHARSGQVIVDLSTANPASTRALQAELAARGVRFLDAGISGGAAAADKGTLTLMVGGDAEALEAVRPLLAAFSAHVHHMGGSGTGHVAKVLNNFLNGVTLAATAEVMVAGKKAGLDLAQLLEVINSSSGVSFASLNRFPHIIKGDYLEGGLTGQLMAKDVRLYLTLTEDLGAATLVGPGTLTAFQVSNALGYGDVISNRVVDAYGDLAGGIRVADAGPGPASTGQPNTGQPNTGHPSTGHPSTGHPSTGQPSTGQPSTGQAGPGQKED
jgi:3-hydroxyisobutyrate dehydrogenase